MWPKDLLANDGFTMLGLGDIVLPGIFIALCLRYDYHLALLRRPATLASDKYPKVYFYSCLTAYILGQSSSLS